MLVSPPRLERAYDVYKLTRDPQVFWLLRLWLTAWWCLVGTSDLSAATGGVPAG